MTDRGAIFSAAMVKAMIDGRKTQTRRLATSPLRRVEPGDRLWVREAWKVSSRDDKIKAGELEPAKAGVCYFADDSGPPVAGRRRTGMHMPRWASRLTLIVEAARIEPLNAISEDDAIAEGIVADEIKGFWVPGVEHPNKNFPYLSRTTAREMYAALWDVLHGSGQWLANPNVVALTFRVERGNIDRLAA